MKQKLIELEELLVPCYKRRILHSTIYRKIKLKKVSKDVKELKKKKKHHHIDLIDIYASLYSRNLSINDTERYILYDST